MVDGLQAGLAVLGHPPAEAVGLGMPALVGSRRHAAVRPAPSRPRGPPVGRPPRRRRWACTSPSTTTPTARRSPRRVVGVAAGHRDALLITLGTGIGGGIISGGRLVRGAHGLAGEPGHMVVVPDGEACPCGRRGCWERYASGSGLALLGRSAAVAGRAPDLVARAGRADAVRGEDVVASASAGDPGGRAVMEEFGGWVALGLANLVNLLDPDGHRARRGSRRCRRRVVGAGAVRLRRARPRCLARGRSHR